MQNVTKNDIPFGFQIFHVEFLCVLENAQVYNFLIGKSNPKIRRIKFQLPNWLTCEVNKPLLT